MITLLTGTPGTGKTAWIIAQLLLFKENNPNFYLFIHGIRNLRGIPHETIYCRSQLCDICRSAVIDQHAKYVEDWVDWKEPESLIVVDEVQRIWRPRVGGSQPSVAVSTLETHRHYGVDFWLISQGPHLFDNFIRLLVGRHVHLVANWAGRKQYEWSECKQDVQSRTDAIVRPYTLPKHVFKHYDSAEVHTKLDKRKPLSFYGVILLFFVAAYLIYNIYHRMHDRLNADQKPAVTQAVAPIDDKTAEASKTALPSASDLLPDKTSLAPKPKYPDFTPTVAGVPESAPAYSELLKVTAVPVIVACIYSKAKDQCNCYTQQATLYQTSKDFCMEDVKGHRFNPYHVQPVKSASSDRKSEPVKTKHKIYEDTEDNESSTSPVTDTQPTVQASEDNTECVIKPVMTKADREACKS